jgi:Concanavalin A-like lectin/glucanases superfamily/Immunoglobulin I-set domain
MFRARAPLFGQGCLIEVMSSIASDGYFKRKRLSLGRLWGGFVLLQLAVAVFALPAGAAGVPAPPGLVGWWPADGNAQDMAGTNNGILMGGATATNAGYDGQCFTFDGTNGYVQIPNAPELNPAQLTVECWVRYSSLDEPGNTANVGTAYMVFKQNPRQDNFEGYNLGKHRYAYDLFVWEVSSAAGQPTQLDSITQIYTNVWYYVAGVRGSNYTQLYINGVLEAQTNVSYPQSYTNLPLYFGTTGEVYYDRKLGGNMDEVSLYNRALSSNEIAAIYAAGAAGKYKSPTIVTQPQSQTNYWGANAAFTPSVAGFNPLSYQWVKNSTTVSNATNSTLSFTNLQLTNAATYSFVVTNSAGTATSAPALLGVKVADYSLSKSGSGPGSPKLTIVGISNQIYGIQGATNLAGTIVWQGLTNCVLISPTNSWTDPRPMTLPQSYYRVVPGPISVP